MWNFYTNNVYTDESKMKLSKRLVYLLFHYAATFLEQLHKRLEKWEIAGKNEQRRIKRI